MNVPFLVSLARTLGWPLVAALLGAGCAAATSTPPRAAGVAPPPELATDVDRARTLVAALATQGVGVSVAVARGGRVVWSEAYGWAGAEHRRPATPATLFRLYSIAKPMTATAAARLIERGRLAADAPVQRWVPSFPDKGATITPMHLGMHTSGIRHYAGDEARSRRHCGSVADALEIFAGDPLVHEPGAGETYSSWGYVLLSAVVERAAERPYPEAMRELVFEPAGLRSLVVDDPFTDRPERASFYREVAPGSFEPEAPVDNTCKWGAGAWLGTASDVARFGLALVDGTLLEPPTQQLFLEGRPVYRAQGIGAGGMAFLLADDGEDLAVALLSNAVGETLGPSLQDGVARLLEIFASTPEGTTRPTVGSTGGRRRWSARRR